MMRRLALLVLGLGAVGLLVLNISVYVQMDSELTEAGGPEKAVSPELLEAAGEMAKGVDEQVGFVKEKETGVPLMTRRVRYETRDPFGIIVRKPEKVEIPFNYKLIGVGGDNQGGWIAVLSDGREMLYAKEGDKIGNSPFEVGKITGDSIEVGGPRKLTLTIGNAKP